MIGAVLICWSCDLELANQLAAIRMKKMAERIWVETLGCPKNQVDSDKLGFRANRAGYLPAAEPQQADLIVVNTCAFIESAREESISTILEMADLKKTGGRLVVTGCMAERYQAELATELPEVDVVVGFGGDFLVSQTSVASGFVGQTSVAIGSKPAKTAFHSDTTFALPEMDLLNLARARSDSPWAYLKVAEGCDRRCGFCAIPSFRGKQRSRRIEEILAEAATLDVKELVLVAQDLASYGRDIYGRPRLVELIELLRRQVDWVRLLYIYPSELKPELIESIIGTGVPYFDLSLQHVSRPLVKRMRRFGSGELFLKRVAEIRKLEPGATLRSSFIIGYPGETEQDHRALLDFLEEAQLDWVGLFAYSREDGTFSANLDGDVDSELAMQRLREASELQDQITRRRRDSQVGRELDVLVDSVGVARSYMEAPEIDGIIKVGADLRVGGFQRVRVTSSTGPDLTAEPCELGV